MVADTTTADSPPPAQELAHTMRSALPAPAGTLPTDIEANEALFTAYNTLAEDVDRTIGSYADACKSLTDDLADVIDRNWLAEIAIAAIPGTLTYLGDDVIPAFSTKLGNTYYASRALNGLTGSEVGDLTSKLIGSIDNIDDAQLASKLASTAGKASDRFLLGYGIVTDIKNGESLDQAILSQGGGAAVGIGTAWIARSLATTATTWAVGGSSVGPWGTVIGGLVGLGVGVGFSMKTEDSLDNWYEDREFEELIRKGLDEQSELP